MLLQSRHFRNLTVLASLDLYSPASIYSIVLISSFSMIYTISECQEYTPVYKLPLGSEMGQGKLGKFLEYLENFKTTTSS